jgi:diguanylate cyclase (GGDEF)-like protein/PAS domain S-box-containing protein
MAALSTLLFMVLQDRALSRDLEQLAEKRLERASAATELLVSSHLAALHDRYEAISGTPQLRATLEVDDGPTLSFYTNQLAAKQGADLIVVLDKSDEPRAIAGDAALSRVAETVSNAELIAHGGIPYAVVSVALTTGNENVGRLIAVEHVDSATVEHWSLLCGADVSFAAPGARSDDVLTRVVQQLSHLDLRVDHSLEAEKEALLHARQSLLAAAAIALAISLIAGALVSRSVVRPIREIQQAVIRIGSGNFSMRFRSRRSDEIGDVTRAFDTMLDQLGDYQARVGEQRKALESNVTRLRTSQEQLAMAQRLAHIGSWQVDLQTGEFSGSDELHEILGRPPEDKSVGASYLSIIHSEDRDDLNDALRNCVEFDSMLRCDCRISRMDGTERIVHLQARVRRNEEGHKQLLEGTVQDITERKRAEEQISYLAYHDNLTGLGNRLFCKERLALEITQARRDESTIGVLFLDLDRFKRINDTLGHSVGDELLKGVADRLAASVRENDFIARREATSSISRLGGDEFTIVLSHVGDVQDLARVARRILAALARPLTLGGHEVVISGSIGITAFPFDGDDVETLLRNADTAMYHAKEQGRNNYQFYTDSMNETAMRRLILENRLRQALEREEFELHYQPKVAMPDGEVIGVEALVRWRDPQAGLMPPAEFIPIAEESGLIVPLGDWVLGEACRQIVALSESGLRLSVAVNLSTQQFRSASLCERVIEILEESRADPRLLELEITESILMHDQQAVIRELEVLRECGIRISVDDFGTGYSSLGYLQRLPVDSLKIDRSFIIDMATSKGDAALTRSIIAMSKALGLTVIAEGVETEAQRDLLIEWGCDQIQGYLYGRPMPANALMEHLKRGAHKSPTLMG